jgi:hypothetical protein
VVPLPGEVEPPGVVPLPGEVEPPGVPPPGEVELPGELEPPGVLDPPGELEPPGVDPVDGLDGVVELLLLEAEPFLPFLPFLFLPFLDLVGCITEVDVTCGPCEVVVVAPAGPADTRPPAARARPSTPAEAILGMRRFMCQFSFVVASRTRLGT